MLSNKTSKFFNILRVFCCLVAGIDGNIVAFRFDAEAVDVLVADADAIFPCDLSI